MGTISSRPRLRVSTDRSGMLARAALAHEADARLLAGDGVVLGQLGEPPVAQEVEAAVADVRGGQLAAIDDDRGQRGGHAAQLGDDGRQIVDLDVGLLDGPVEPLGAWPSRPAARRRSSASPRRRSGWPSRRPRRSRRRRRRPAGRSRALQQLAAVIFVVLALGADVRQRRHLQLESGLRLGVHAKLPPCQLVALR